MSLPIDTPLRQEARPRVEAGGKPQNLSAMPDSRPLSDLTTSLELLDDEFKSHATSLPPKKAVIKSRHRPDSASFHTARYGPPHSTRSRLDGVPQTRQKFAIGAGLTSLVAAAAVGFWYLNPIPGLAAIQVASSPPQPQQRPEQTAAAVPSIESVSNPATSANRAAMLVPPLPQKGRGELRESLHNFQNQPANISASVEKLNPQLERGYQAYTSGRLDEASAEYRQLLQVEPANSAALHGMAAISLRQGQIEAAWEYYLRAIETDPKDALALAGLINLGGHADPLQAENRLMTQLATQPDQPSLNFALGNLYARQKRWGEAQQAYFKACAGDPENPDMLFNLAVSLDQLRQHKLAAQYYNLALSAEALKRPASFDRMQVVARLRDLQQ